MASPQTLKRIKAIQARLGLTADGIIGPATLTVVEHLIEKVLGPPTDPVAHTMKISRKGMDQIVDFEIYSKANYNRRLKSPTWPGIESGVTIGIGYDLGYHSESKIEKDWKGQIDDVDLEDLKAVSGLRGQAAKAKIHSLRHISISIEVAQEVFLTSVLADQAKKTIRAYPGVEKLPADAQAMLVSLIFNRGGSLKNTDRRKEMRAIRPLVALGDLAGIAAQIRAMKRLWEGLNMGGLLKRRNKEADFIEHARDDGALPESEIILV